MTKSEERNLFLRKLAKIYAQNPDLPITKDTIYRKLSSFNVYNDNDEQLARISLLNVQLSLNEKYKNDERVKTFTFGKGYFWVIENRGGLSEEDYHNKMVNAIKLYIPVGSTDINYIADSLFEFMIKEGIINQSKIAKEFRNDALVVRVSTKEEAKKVIDFYHEKFGFDCRVKPNPFIPNDDKVAVAMDGRLSYNTVLAKSLELYYKKKRQEDSLDKVDEKDFQKFLNKELLAFKNGDNKEMLAAYGLNDARKVLNYMVINGVISGNISGAVNMKNLFNYQKVEGEIKNFDSGAKRISLLYIMNNLNNKYGKDGMHKIINYYLDTGDINAFTRENDVRKMAFLNFDPTTLEKMLGEISYSALVDASFETDKKYGTEQLGYAIGKLFREYKIDGFTNTNDVRSYLGFIANDRIMHNVLLAKMNERNLEYTYENVYNMILEEIEKKKNKEKGPVR